ncbi:MAG: response regulator [Verrucomicrobiota bacterium]|nr:response regulator [Verrucomicrobiota bacterium]
MSPALPNNPPSGGRVLVLEPDEQLGADIVRALGEAAPAAQVSLAKSLGEAQQLVMHDRPDLFVLDIDATYDLGQEFLYDLRTSHPNARAIVLTGVHLSAHRESAAGLGAIHFLEKPFPHADFVTLVEALLAPGGQSEGEKFQGTLSDLHIADIIQLKCMSGSTSALEFTGPRGEKARVFFEAGQVRHATALGKEGVAAFNEIVDWKGGKISELSGAEQSPRTIDTDWQVLLMDAVRQMDESRGTAPDAVVKSEPAARKILVIDDSLMLLSFVQEILGEAHYEVTTAATATEGLAAAAASPPDLILLDYVLPDMKGDEVSRRLAADPATAKARVVYMSGFGTDVLPEQMSASNVIGSLNKPFTSDLLTKTVETYMLTENTSSETPAESRAETPITEDPAHLPPWQAAAVEGDNTPASDFSGLATSETEGVAAVAAGAGGDAWWSAPITKPSEPTPPAAKFTPTPQVDFAPTPEQFSPTPNEFAEPTAEPAPAWIAAAPAEEAAPIATPVEPLPVTGNTFFAGDTSFFSLNWALQTIGKQKLTGILRAFWDHAPLELIARHGQILLVTTRDPELYCPEAPITLVNVDAEQTENARAEQRETGCPLFIALARQNLILREPAMQLVQHYGQKLFAQLWTAKRVQIVFELTDDLGAYVDDLPPDEDIDQWALSTLRFLQSPELPETSATDSNRIPAYTRDGYERVQRLRLTVAEAQFASQFNGARSIAQIAKNLRLDFKFARLTLFRFLALEIVECWPPSTAVKPERRGFFGKLGFGG